MSSTPRRRPASPPADPRRPQSGFTLIEILMAMMIFLAGVAGIYGLMSTALGMQRQGMDTGRLTRRLEAVVHQVELELSAGLHWDEEAGAYTDITAGSLEDGTMYAVHFRPEVGNEAEGTLVAEVRVARSAGALERAPVVEVALSPGPTTAAAVARYREGRRGRAAAR